jgi:anhydro-N-acetylmuramic acid kinase
MPLFIGLMSGTSMDAVDAALVAFTGEKADLLEFYQLAYPEALRADLLPTCHPQVHLALEDCGRLSVRIGRLFAAAAQQLLHKAGLKADQITAIGSHGQTILHRPQALDPFTLQIGDPSTIASLTGITTVADFRSPDIAAGGQGAPLAPAFHEAQFRDSSVNHVVLNIGGIANITVLPADPHLPASGFDTGPGNALLDNWAQKHLGIPFDKEGQWARRGTIHQELLQGLKLDPYFELPPPKSTGRDHFNLDWLERILKRMATPPLPEDVQASLVRLTTDTIATAIGRYAPLTEEILVCGGGAYNPVLLEALREVLAPCRVDSTAHYGLPPNCIEAVAFAWLAKRRLEGRPGNLPAVTGARRPLVLGAIYASNSK